MKRLCTICARGGSKGVPGKNIRPLLGKSLIQYSIDCARDTGLFELIAVSSDADDILAAAKQAGADILIKRPAELATDQAGKHPAILHAVQETEKQTGQIFSTLVDLDATAPLRVAEDVVKAVALLEQTGASSVMTGSPAHRSPYFNLMELQPSGSVSLSKPSQVVRRQDAPACFDMNASIYVWQRNAFFKEPKNFYPDTRLLVMPRERSLDIDSEMDFTLVELYMKEKWYLKGTSYAP